MTGGRGKIASIKHDRMNHARSAMSSATALRDAGAVTASGHGCQVTAA